VLLENPVREVATLHAFAPGEPVLAVEELDVTTGSRYAFYPEFLDLLPSRLFFFDGGSRSGPGEGLGAYRLLAESRTPVTVLDLPAQRYKLFGVVRGAMLQVHGATPGARVTARVLLRSNQGRRFSWGTSAAASGTGEATLRLPYATGWNGLVSASACRVEDGARATTVEVPEEHVLGGTQLPVRLPP
jgi:hypothetical protein